jgi:hypothetical protein
MDRNTVNLIGLIGSGLLGLALGWFLGRPPDPWLDFDELQAFYELDARQITTAGHYEVSRECDVSKTSKGTEPAGSSRVIWRYEAISSDGQIAVYGPRPPAPSFANGEHRYTGSIPLLREIDPDGWVVRVLITCPGEAPETVTSPPARLITRGE